ncbi:MAG TPA: DinB family protein [Bryobacteraceae bacterium]|nr:DinB family protein [Bryobacteraceae bacterium]
MHLSHDEAKLIAGYTLTDYQREMATTRAVISAIPPGKEAYAPDAKSMPALKLAWHIASADCWFLTSVIKGEFTSGDSSMPDNIKSAADVIAWYDASLPGVIEQAKSLSGEDVAKTLDFFGMMQAPAVVFISLMVKHSIHHRGQLSAYLRPMGAKVPGIYGPSGDSAGK